MKKLSIALLFAAITFSASAQRHFGGGGFHGGGYHGGFYGPNVSFGIGYPFYSPFYYPYGYGYPYYGYSYVPSELDLQIKDIKNDYKQRIWEAKHDKAVPKSERRKNARQLEHDEDQQIINAQRDYYNQHYNNNNNSNNSNNNSNNNSSDSTNNVK
jgi:hypothetical protein